MTQLINELLIPAYNLYKGKDYYSGFRIDEQDAKKNAKSVLTELAKVSIAVGGFFAISAVMKRMPSPLSAWGAGSFLLGGALFFSPKISIILRDASFMTAGLFVLQKGFVDVLVVPFVQSVKAAGLCLYHARLASIWQNLSVNILFSGVLYIGQKIGMGFLRGIGPVSLSVAYSLIPAKSEKVSKSQKAIDKAIFKCIKKVASFIGSFFARPLPPSEKIKKLLARDSKEQTTSSFQLFRREL